MFGASALKLVKFGFDFSSMELAILAVGLISAFVVSILAIKFLMSYIKSMILPFSAGTESCSGGSYSLFCYRWLI